MFSKQGCVIEIEDDDEAHFELQPNKPRNIIFCIDMSIEMNEDLLPSANCGAHQNSLYKSTRLETVQRFLLRYALMNKMIGNIRDKYAIVTLTNEATWWYGSSTDSERLKNELMFLDSQVTNEYDELHTKSIFKVINENVDLSDDSHFTQVIVLYARTNVRPMNPKREKIESVRDSPNFTMDVIFMHDQTSSVQEVYDIWNGLDSSVNSGWYYELGSFRGKDKIAKALSELLAHPIQRGEQEASARHVILPVSSSF